MPIKIDASRRNKASKRPAGRPNAIEGESLVVVGDMLRAMVPPSSGGVYFLPSDQIIIRKGWSTYREMRHDDQVKATLAFKKVLVGGRKFEIKPKDQTDAAREIAEFVQENLKRINFAQIIREALSAFEFGFSFGEVVWELADYVAPPKPAPKPAAPKPGAPPAIGKPVPNPAAPPKTKFAEGVPQRALMLKDIKHRDPQSIEIKMDEHGNVLQFRQIAPGRLIEIDPDKAWHWAHNKEFGNAYGRSDLRAAYGAWWAKKFIVNFWNVFLERMGSPMMLMKYPQGAGDQLKDVLKQIMAGISTKTEVLVPEGVQVELIEAKRTGNGDYGAALEYADNRIARAMLMVGLLGMGSVQGGRTADSQSRLQLRVLFKMADQIGADLMWSFTNQVIKPLVDMNFEHTQLYPEFIWQDYGEFEGIEVAATIKDLFTAGILDMDQSDVNYVRSIMGLPLRGENDVQDVVQRPPDASQIAAAGPPGGGGGGGLLPPKKPPQGNARAAKGAGGGRKTEPNSTKVRV